MSASEALPFTTSGRCCSDLKLDRLLNGELDEEAAASLRVHLEGSVACRRRLDELEAARAAWRAEAPALDLEALRAPRGASSSPSAPPRSRGRVPFLVAAGSGLAAAAAAVLLSVGVGTPAVDEVRTKGDGAALSFHVLHDGVARAGRDGEVVAPGDRLRFTVRVAEDAHVVVLGRDASGAVSVYAGPAAVARGERPLADAVELDDVLGDERLFLFACAAPPAIDALKAAVATDAPRAEGCVVDVARLVKVAR